MDLSSGMLPQGHRFGNAQFGDLTLELGDSTWQHKGKTCAGALQEAAQAITQILLDCIENAEKL